MDGHSFRAVFAVIHNLDLWDLEDAGVINRGAQGGSDWDRFNRDFGTFVLKLPSDRLDKLVALIQSRLPQPVAA